MMTTSNVLEFYRNGKRVSLWLPVKDALAVTDYSTSSSLLYRANQLKAVKDGGDGLLVDVNKILLEEDKKELIKNRAQMITYWLKYFHKPKDIIKKLNVNDYLLHQNLSTSSAVIIVKRSLKIYKDEIELLDLYLNDEKILLMSAGIS